MLRLLGRKESTKRAYAQELQKGVDEACREAEKGEDTFGWKGIVTESAVNDISKSSLGLEERWRKLCLESITSCPCSIDLSCGRCELLVTEFESSDKLYT